MLNIIGLFNNYYLIHKESRFKSVRTGPVYVLLG